MAVFAYLVKGVNGFCAYCYRQNIFIKLLVTASYKIFFAMELETTLNTLNTLNHIIQ